MRDGKIIILADGDPDGSNISALILGALTYLVPEIIAAGKVYEGIAPLYKQDGQFIWNDDDLGRPKPFKRYKGLGSMSPDDFYDSVLDPQVRALRQITLQKKERVIGIMIDL